MREHWLKLIADSERRTEVFLAMQVRDPASPDRGAVLASWAGPQGHYADPKPTLGLAGVALSVYLCPDSRMAGDERIPEAFGLALDYAARVQNADGTFDYRPCNFRSAPDTAFIVENALVSLGLLERSMKDDGRLRDLHARLLSIIGRAAEGMAANGFHTPNHRWAIAATLSACGRLSGEARYVRRADDYLREGLDCNAEGEWSERSAGNYNMVNNQMMLLLAESRGDEAFLDPVERNLEMMFAYIDPDGSVFTNNSTRQDRGTKSWLDNYWFQYLFMARRRGNPRFASAARRIMDGIIASGREAPPCLGEVMLRFGSLDYGPGEAPIPSDYRKHYEESGIVRVRRGGYSFSLVKGAGRFLYFQSGSVTAFLKLGVSYFDKREVRPESIEERDGAFVLRFLARGWYYLPFEEAPATSDWWRMDNASRPRQEGPDLSFELRVREIGDGIELAAKAGGWAGVPIRFELGFSAGSGPGLRIGTEHFEVEGRQGEAILAKSGMLRAWQGLDAMEIGPAFAEHRDMGGTYGSEARSRDHFTAYFTASSPVERTISFRRVPPLPR